MPQPKITKKEKAKQKADKKRTARLLSTKALDLLWAKQTKKAVDYKCEYCGNPNSLNSHHVFGRTNHNVRWDYRNACVLCAGCHVFRDVFSAHKTPGLFMDWIKEKRGKEWYQDLMIRARVGKIDRALLREELEKL